MQGSDFYRPVVFVFVIKFLQNWKLPVAYAAVGIPTVEKQIRTFEIFKTERLSLGIPDIERALYYLSYAALPALESQTIVNEVRTAPAHPDNRHGSQQADDYPGRPPSAGKCYIGGRNSQISHCHLHKIQGVNILYSFTIQNGRIQNANYFDN